MSETTNPSEKPYDPNKDPDADPGMLEDRKPADKGVNERDQAEGAPDEAPAQ